MSLLTIDQGIEVLNKYPKYYIENIRLRSNDELDEDTEIYILISGKNQNHDGSILSSEMPYVETFKHYRKNCTCYACYKRKLNQQIIGDLLDKCEVENDE